LLSVSLAQEKLFLILSENSEDGLRMASRDEIGHSQKLARYGSSAKHKVKEWLPQMLLKNGGNIKHFLHFIESLDIGSGIHRVLKQTTKGFINDNRHQKQ